MVREWEAARPSRKFLDLLDRADAMAGGSLDPVVANAVRFRWTAMHHMFERLRFHGDALRALGATDEFTRALSQPVRRARAGLFDPQVAAALAWVEVVASTGDDARRGPYGDQGVKRADARSLFSEQEVAGLVEVMATEAAWTALERANSQAASWYLFARAGK